MRRKLCPKAPTKERGGGYRKRGRGGGIARGGGMASGGGVASGGVWREEGG